MPLKSKYLYVVGMDIDREHEEIFNALHAQEHVPNLLSVPGVTSAARFKRRAGNVIIDGREQPLPLPDSDPSYYAMYELEHAEALVSDEWIRAGKVGQWPTKVSPFITNRRRLLLERFE